MIKILRKKNRSDLRIYVKSVIYFNDLINQKNNHFIKITILSLYQMKKFLFYYYLQSKSHHSSRDSSEKKRGYRIISDANDSLESLFEVFYFEKSVLPI